MTIDDASRRSRLTLHASQPFPPQPRGLPRFLKIRIGLRARARGAVNPFPRTPVEPVKRTLARLHCRRAYGVGRGPGERGSIRDLRAVTTRPARCAMPDLSRAGRLSAEIVTIGQIARRLDALEDRVERARLLAVVSHRHCGRATRSLRGSHSLEQEAQSRR